MRPVLFEAFGFPVPAWHVLFVLAFCVAFFHLFFVSQLRPQLFGGRAPFVGELEKLVIFSAVVYAVGLVGARLVDLLGLASVPDFGAHSHAHSHSVDGPLTFYGSIGCAGLVAVVLLRRWRLDFWNALDFVAPAVLLGLAVGRVGCLLNGDDYGALLPGVNPENAPFWSWPAMGPGLGYRYPTQLQESLASFALWASGTVALWWRCRGGPKLPVGSVGVALTVLSCANRFANEFFRGDPRGYFFSTPLSFSQGVALVLVVVVLASWRMARTMQRSPRSTHVG